MVAMFDLYDKFTALLLKRYWEESWIWKCKKGS